MGIAEAGKDHLDDVFWVKGHLVAITEVEGFSLDGADCSFIASSDAFDSLWAKDEDSVVFQPGAKGGKHLKG